MYLNKSSYCSLHKDNIDSRGCIFQVKEFVSYDDRNFYLPAVKYTHADGKGPETLDVIFKVTFLVITFDLSLAMRCMIADRWTLWQVHNGVESDDVDLIRAHNTVLTYLQKEGVIVPEPLAISTGMCKRTANQWKVLILVMTMFRACDWFC